MKDRYRKIYKNLSFKSDYEWEFESDDFIPIMGEFDEYDMILMFDEGITNKTYLEKCRISYEIADNIRN